MRRQSGQAAVEYLALVALVALVLGGLATVVVATGVGERVVAAVRRALCVVSGGDCSPGLQPCVTATRGETDSGQLNVGLFRLGGDEALLREERSDGTVALTTMRSSSAGVEAGLGADARLRFGRRGMVFGNELRAAALAAAGTGETYVVSGSRAADELERRLRESALARQPQASIANPNGSLVLTRPMPRLPRPDQTFHERGREFSLDGSVGWKGAKAGLVVGVGDTAGERVDEATGWRTVYLRGHEELSVSATLATVGGEAIGLRRELYAVTVDRAGRPLELEVVGAAALAGGARLPGAVGSGLARALGLPTASPRVVEVDERLDLTDPDNLAVARDFLAGVVGGGPGAAAADGLRRRLALDGTAEARAYATSESGRGFGGHLAGGLKWGGSVGSRVATSRLLRAVARGAGGGWRVRGDCAVT